MDGDVGSGKELLQLLALQTAVRLIVGIGKWLVNIRDQNTAGVRPNQPLHLFRLPNAFAELFSVQYSE